MGLQRPHLAPALPFAVRLRLPSATIPKKLPLGSSTLLIVFHPQLGAFPLSHFQLRNALLDEVIAGPDLRNGLSSSPATKRQVKVI